MARVRRLGVAALCVLSLTACASTLQQQRDSVTTTGAGPLTVGGDGLSLATAPAPAASGGAARVAAPPTAVAPRAGSRPSASSPVAASTAGGPRVSASAAALIPTSGPGWDAHHVYLGITTASDASGALHALGISLDPGNEIADAKAIVAGLNKEGGLFGRQIVLIDKDDASARVLSDPAGAGQADCVYFTQDHPVISVVNTDATLELDSFRSCFAHAHVPLVTVTTAPFDDGTEASLAPYFYNALSVSWTRLIPVLVSRLAAEHYFTGWNSLTGTPAPGPVKVGLLYGADPTGSRIGAALTKALRAAGVATDHFQYDSASDTAAALSAVLRFKADRVTHVIGVDSFQYFFMVAANTQGFLPRYGLTTYNAPQALLQSNGNARQLAGAVGLGWYPSLDVDATRSPSAGPNGRRCLAALAAGGQHFAGHRFAEAVGFAMCDGLQLGVLGAKAGHGLDPASIRSGIVALGPHYPTAGAFTSGLSQTNFALPGGARDLAWNPSCKCFAYHGSTYPIR
ncbi:MAG TPA: ABC transporter substrate-binding protein [Mycobacteriales bacterium]|nr:ABC transporter substrate-binding protein [Mycobacteriales bacterium]